MLDCFLLLHEILHYKGVCVAARIGVSPDNVSTSINCIYKAGDGAREINCGTPGSAH